MRAPRRRRTSTPTGRLLIQRLVVNFNEALKLELINDGRRIGLVLLDEAVRQVVNFPGTYGILNSSMPVCDLSKSQLTPPSILDCTEFTLIIGGTGSSASSGPTTGTFPSAAS